MRVWMEMLSVWMSIRVTPRKIVKYIESLYHGSQNNLEFIASQTVKASSIQLRVRGYKDLKDYLKELMTLTKNAVDEGAQLVVFPEYAGLLAGTLLPTFDRLLFWAMEGRMPDSLAEVELESKRVHIIAESFQNYICETYIYTFSTIARLYHIYVVAGSCIFYENGKLYNRSLVFGPDGEPIGSQDKTAPLGFDAVLGISPATTLEIFDTDLGKLAVVLGSDAYYFEYFQIAAARGAKIIAVPDASGGIVRDLLRCRANEFAVYVLYSCFSNPQNADTRSGILAPMDLTTENIGLLKVATSTKACAVTTRLNLTKLERSNLLGEPNFNFRRGDFLRSYRYYGVFPINGTDISKQLEDDNRIAVC